MATSGPVRPPISSLVTVLLLRRSILTERMTQANVAHVSVVSRGDERLVGYLG